MSFQGDSIFWVEVEKIVANPFQPRREFDEEKLNELAESVRMYGILQPLTVTRKEVHREDGTFYTEYELIAGERRLRASKIAGLKQVPVIIREGEQTEQEKLELAIIENLQREDLNAVDRAMAFKQLSEVFGLSHAKVAKKVGRSREYVSNSIRLLMLPDYMLNSLKLGDISEGHARTLLMLNDRPEEQDTIFREILLKKLSVREVEKITRKIAQDKVRNPKWKDTDPELIEMERQFTESLGTRVQIAKTDFGGRLTIDYFSADDLETLLELARHREEYIKKSSADLSDEVDTSMDDIVEHTALEPVVEEAPVVSQSEPNAIEDSEPIPQDSSFVGPETKLEPEKAPDTTPAPPQQTQQSEFPQVRPVEDEGKIEEKEIPQVGPVGKGVTDDSVDNSGVETVDSGVNEELQKDEDKQTNKQDESDLYSIKNFGI